MTKHKKRLEGLRANPKNVRADELDTVLRDFGFIPDFKATSHVTYRHASGAKITVASHTAYTHIYRKASA